jgi:hypothetical protein
MQARSSLPQLLSSISFTDKERLHTKHILNKLERRERLDLREFFISPAMSRRGSAEYPEVRLTNEHMFKSISKKSLVLSDFNDQQITRFRDCTRKKFTKPTSQDFNNWELAECGRIKVRERKRRKEILSELASMKSYLPPPLKKPLTQNEKAMQASLKLLDQRRKQTSFLLQGNQAVAYYRVKPRF